MGRIDVIAGIELIEINKKKDRIRLRFQDHKAQNFYTLLFKGWLFETSVPAAGLRVLNVSLTDSIGFRGLNQLRRVNQDVTQYHQLFIQMENDTEDKAELIGVFKQYKLKETSADMITDQKGAMPATN